VLKRYAPDATDEDIYRGAHEIALAYGLACKLEPWEVRRGTTPALKRLSAIHNNLKRVWKLLSELGPDEKIALREATQADLMEQLAVINKSVVAAHQWLVEQPLQRTKLGRPFDFIAMKVSHCAGGVYARLTKKQPTRLISRDTGAPVGKFDAVLTSIFNVLGLEASADYQVRPKAQREKKSKKR